MPVSSTPATPASPPASPSIRPPMPGLDPGTLAVLDWLAANGITEPVPEDVVIVVDGGEITYTAWAFTGDVRTWQAGIEVDADNEVIVYERTVPLLAAPGEQVVDALGAQLRIGPTS